MRTFGAISGNCAKCWVKRWAGDPLIKIDKSELDAAYCLTVSDTRGDLRRHAVVRSGPSILVKDLVLPLRRVLTGTQVVQPADNSDLATLCRGETLLLRTSDPTNLYHVNVRGILCSYKMRDDMVLWNFLSLRAKTGYHYLAPVGCPYSHVLALFFHALHLDGSTIHYEIFVDHFPLLLGEVVCSSTGEGFRFGRMLDANRQPQPQLK